MNDIGIMNEGRDNKNEMPTVLITGSAGFIGFHLSQLLLAEGFKVVGYDGMTDYYDVALKQRRIRLLCAGNGHYLHHEAMLEDESSIRGVFKEHQPDLVVHLAAQAGVRYSLENPRAYLDSNLVGTFNVLECARDHQVKHLLMASTSSVYGAEEQMPFHELQKVDTPLSFYAATKKANEAMSHSYAYLWGLPITMFRFFTVYGPWGRPDMALFKFTKGIIEGKPIDIYNNGEMYRDFTFVDDLVRGIRGLIDAVPPTVADRADNHYDPVKNDSLSQVAPWRVVNVGNSEKVALLDFIEAIEKRLGKPAIRNYMPMQTGDVPATWANADLLKALTGDQPATHFLDGVNAFVDWYVDYYGEQ